MRRFSNPALGTLEMLAHRLMAKRKSFPVFLSVTAWRSRPLVVIHFVPQL